MFIFQLIKNLHHFFPELFDRLREITDLRNSPQYSIEEIIFAAIAIHIFKAGSRNNFNNLDQGKFAQNYYRAFKMNLPHLDTVDLVMRKIENDELENLKRYLVKGLIKKKIFYKYKVFKRNYNITIDGTGVMNISKKNIKNFPGVLFKIYNKGKDDEKIIYFINVLEAKLVCSNGFCISIETQWIENSNDLNKVENEYKKQDCELKAFKRLAEKLKKNFPRLPICIVGDGLYPCKTIFEICESNNWEWIFTFKDGNLKSVWKKVNLIEEMKGPNTRIVRSKGLEKDENDKTIEKEILKIYSWINSIDYNGHELNWSKMVEIVEGEVRHTFVYISSFKSTENKIEEIILNGRLRSKIENEGFNTQKNLGYGLQHKYSEVSENATKNYYSCLQIGHLMNQLIELQVKIKELTKGRETIKNLWFFFIGFFTFNDLNFNEFSQYIKTKAQVRFE